MHKTNDSKCKSKITITDGKKLVNPKSILSLMSAGIQRGTDVEVICEGDSEEEDLRTIIAAIESGLGEL
ncbi:HPr family phosphocarrier protein [Proteiniclasticum sediminis]|uniref:HPr family phosphocarrier protein n=1 Tax=Proteiniclasticum sediminis TaxID=2804028 RepID=UPI002EDA9506